MVLKKIGGLGFRQIPTARGGSGEAGLRRGSEARRRHGAGRGAVAGDGAAAAVLGGGFRMGWRQRAAGGQFVFRWMASRAGMRHEGSWWDPAGDPCPDGKPDIFSCFKNRQIGMDEAAFTEFAAKVFTANKERKSAKARRWQEAGTNCKCS